MELDALRNQELHYLTHEVENYFQNEYQLREHQERKLSEMIENKS